MSASGDGDNDASGNPRASPSMLGSHRGSRDIPRDPSRFRIEFVEENNGNHDHDRDDDRQYMSGGDTTGQKTFGRNTLETLPHADHYRNLLSATGVIRKRPTLLELHELDVAVSRVHLYVVVISFAAGLKVNAVP